jgi:acyl-CoA dehydrogenase
MLTLAAAALLLGLLFARRAYWSWVATGGLLLLGWLFSGPDSWLSFSATAALFGALAFVFGQPQRRCRWITPQLMPRVGRLLPRLGETERIALEAGTVWWDKELFSGAPSWQVSGDGVAHGGGRNGKGMRADGRCGRHADRSARCRTKR